MTPQNGDRPSGHEALLAATRRQAALTTGYYKANRRFLRFVDTHQKWLLVHLLTAVASNAPADLAAPGVAVNWISDRAVETGIASRNTTLAFFHQLHAYGYLTRTACQEDRRIKRVALTAEAEGVLADWAMMVLNSVEPQSYFGAISDSQGLAVYRRMAQLLLATPRWINPPLDIRLTQEVRGGWLVMNRILGLIEQDPFDSANLAVRDFSVAHTAQTFSLSRSTLYRLLAKAGEAGTLNYEELDGIPTLAINAYHLRQYCRWNGHLLAAAWQAARERMSLPLQVTPQIHPPREAQPGQGGMLQLAT